MRTSLDSRSVLRRGPALCLSFVLLIPPLWAAEESVSESSYDVFYEARVRSDCLARVGIRVARNDNLLARLRIHIEKGQQFDFEGSGRIDTETDHVTWSILSLPETSYGLIPSHRTPHGPVDGTADSRGVPLRHCSTVLNA